MKSNGIDGIIERTADGGSAVKFDRLIDRPVEKIWEALTDPKVLANWIGTVEVELRVGGKYEVHFRESKNVMTGRITQLEPMRLLEYSWLESHIPVPQSLVRWELRPEGSGCRLKLTHSIPATAPWDEVVGYAGGWQDFLEHIPRASDGAFVPYDHENYKGLDQLYRAKFAHLEKAS
jgi:uncharacterized protein YndB with AHSA1/START domain